jgi:C4-dicarboxylate transporter, DctM subunit
MIALPLVVLVVALIFGVPIAVALAGAGMLGIYLVTGDFGKVMGILSLAPFSTVADYALTTIPMFILMAFFSASSGLARDLYTAASNWCSHIRGGLAIATVFACGIFGAMSGASTAAASVMAKIAMPEMRRHGYSDELAAGAIGIGATLDILIPPSIAMVIYGIATQTSIGKLLIAGVVPGVIAGILLAAMVYLWVVVSPKHAPSTYRVDATERWASLLRVWPSLLLILLVLALLYTGVATPTEVGALGALLAGVIGAVFGRLTWEEAIDAVMSTIRTSAMIFLILLGATIFGYYMALSRIPQEVVTAVTAMELNRWVVIIGIVVAYFVISMFMVAMGLVFPPVGLIAFIVSATAGVDLMKVYKGTSILMLSIVATTVLLMIFPQIALWLPATMR